MNSDEKKKAIVLALGVAGIVGLVIRAFTQARRAEPNTSSRNTGSRKGRNNAGGSGATRTDVVALKELHVTSDQNRGEEPPAPVQHQQVDQHPQTQHHGFMPVPFQQHDQTPFEGTVNSLDGGSSMGEGPETETELQNRLDGFRLRSPVQPPNRPFGSTGGHMGGRLRSRLSGDMGHDDENDAFSYEDSITSNRLGSTQMGYKKGRRNTVVGHSTNLDETRMYQPQNQPKTQNEKDQLFAALSKCHLFAHLDEEEVNQVLGTMERCLFNRGEYVTKAGEVTESDSHKFFVVLEGEISVIEHNTVVRLLSSGSCFGESHIMFIQPRFMWTHRVDTNTALCFSLDANAYRHIVTRAAVNKRELYEGFLDRVSWLKGLDRKEKLQLADCLQPVVYHDGHYLIEYNTLGEWVFVILEGTVDVFGRDDQGEVLNVCSFGVGDCVGELEFINHHRTVADVRAKGRVKAARLHREHFEMCMGPIVDVLQRTAVADPKYAYYQTRIRTMRRAE